MITLLRNLSSFHRSIRPHRRGPRLLISRIAIVISTLTKKSASEMDHDNDPATTTSGNQTQTELLTISSDGDVNLGMPGISCGSACVFSMLETDTSEIEQRSESATKLIGLIFFYLIIMVVETVGGVKANSLAVLTDAAHMLVDIASFSVSLMAVWASNWNPTSRHSFGFHRSEVLGALLSIMLIWLVCVFLVYEAVDRFLHGSAMVDGKVMFVVSTLGFITNLVMVLWLGHGHSHHSCTKGNHQHNHHHNHNENDHHIHGAEIEYGVAEEENDNLLSSPEKNKAFNINVQGAYLHVMADLAQSVAVMIAGAIIWTKPNLLVVDLICTGVSSVFILSSTVSMLTDLIGILMEGTPSEVDIIRLEKGLKSIQGVAEIHDLHVWSITVGKIALSCHAVVDPGVEFREILHDMREYCKRKYRINHTTIQIE